MLLLVSDLVINPIQVGVVCYYRLGGGGGGTFPPFLLYLLSNCHQTWDASTMAKKSLKGSKGQIHNDVTMMSMMSSLLC